jgi:Zn-dependent protease with chaperone function
MSAITQPTALPNPLRGTLFDTRSALGIPVDILLFGTRLIIEGDPQDAVAPRISMQAKEARLREVFDRAPLVLDLPGGVVCELPQDQDARSMRALRAQLATPPGMVERLTRSNRGLAAVAVAFAAFLVFAYTVLIPQAAVTFASWMPQEYADTLDTAVMRYLDDGMLRPSRLPDARREVIAKRFDQLKLPPEVQEPRHEVVLKFRAAPRIGANAFALPGGTIVVTDELIRLAPSDDAVLGVLAHEMGHVAHQHGLQNLVRSTALGLFFAVYTGDFSAVAAAAGTLIAQTKYSRDAEREADDYALAVMRANGISPVAMAEMFRKFMEQERDQQPVPEFILTHPATEERIKRFEAAR